MSDLMLYEGWLALDIETVPAPELNLEHGDPDIIPQFIPPELKLGNLKDPAKIRRKEEDHEQAVIRAQEAWNADLGRKCSLDPHLAGVACIALWYPGGSTILSTQLMSETDMLKTLWDIIRGGRMMTKIVTHNGRNFDMPILFNRSIKLNAFKSADAGIVYDSYLLPNWKTPSHIDVYEYTKRALAFLAKRYLRKAKIDISSFVQELVTEGKWETLHAGCTNHAMLTYYLADKFGLLGGESWGIVKPISENGGG